MYGLAPHLPNCYVREVILRRLFTVLVGASLLATAACGNPCRELSLKVCDCKPTQALRQACIARVRARAAAASGDAQAADQKSCAARLEQCSCAALAAGNLQACGLSNEDLAAP